MKSLHNIYSEIMRDVRSGRTMGGSFDGVDKKYNGLCFTYEDLEIKERKLAKQLYDYELAVINDYMKRMEGYLDGQKTISIKRLKGIATYLIKSQY